MMMQINQLELVEQCKKVLQNNLRGGFTVPSSKLYPFQWNWDSGFVSIGFANYDVDAAISELQSLLAGQWDNGMIPHIIFHSEKEKSYFPNWDFWNTAVNKGASQHPKTSGITQPPVLGFVLEHILNKHPKDSKVIDFIKYAFPKIVKYHQFWYDYRDPKKEGLAFIFHPWESGRDNSPLWDEALDSIDLTSARLPTYQRRDLTLADASERPTNQQYDQYIYLLELGKRHQYDGPGIAEESAFLIQDTVINAMLIRSNQGLINIGQKLGFDVGQIKEWQQQSRRSYEQKLWNAEINNYTDYDLRQGKQLPIWEIGGLTALFAQIPSQEKAASIKNYLEQLVRKDYMLTPSFDVAHPLFDSKRYWRGPVWPQMNWLLYHGLKDYGFQNLADTTKDNLIELVHRFGFHEYFESQKHLIRSTHGGYGGSQFSWTASSILDLILSP